MDDILEFATDETTAPDGLIQPGDEPATTSEMIAMPGADSESSENSANSEMIGRAIGSMISPTIGYTLAFGALGHYHGGKTGALIGGLIGYFIGSHTKHDPAARAAAIRSVLNSARAQNRPDAGISGNDIGIMSAYDLMNYSYQKYAFDGKWGDLVGQPSINFHAMIYGRPKQGKSILAFQWAKYLSENFGRVLYVASEEGFSVTLQKKVVDFATDNNNLDFANFRDFQQIRSAVSVGNYRFVFIDSVNYIRIAPEDVEVIKEENPETAFITIQQATKDGKFRGSQQFAHNCDIIIQVEAGVAYHQGRFQEGTEMPVFDSPERNANDHGGKSSQSAQPAAMGSDVYSDQMELSF